MGNVTQFIIAWGDEGQRIDNYLLKEMPQTPRSHLYKMIRKGSIRCNGKRVKVTYKLKLHDQVSLPFLLQKSEKVDLSNLEITQRLKQAIIFEDEHLVVINKPAHVAAQAGTGIAFGVVDYLGSLYDKLYLVHRLDRPTTGVLVLAKSARACRMVQEAMALPTCQKTYQALVHGRWNLGEHAFTLHLEKERERVVVRQDGKLAKTDVKPLQLGVDFSWLNVRIHTGRMHQIRVTLAHAGFPIVGDKLYGGEPVNEELEGRDNLFLHAHSLVLELAGNKYEFIAPLSRDKQQCIEKIFKRKD